MLKIDIKMLDSKYRHKVIIDILNTNNITIKDFADMCGYDVQSVWQIINYVRIPKKIDTKKIYKVLKRLDSSISYKDIFPANFDNICDMVLLLKSDCECASLDTVNIEDFVDELIYYDYINYDKMDIDKAMDLCCVHYNWARTGFSIIRKHHGFYKDDKIEYTIGEISKFEKISYTRCLELYNQAICNIKNILIDLERRV